MPDFFVCDPEETLFNLRDMEGRLLGTVDALDIIYTMQTAKERASESGSVQNWFMYFEKTFFDITGVKISKTQAILLLREAEASFEKLKKSGLAEQKPQEQSEELETSPTETTES